MHTNNERVGYTSLGLALAGVVAPFVLVAIKPSLRYEAPWPLIILAIELSAFVIGVIGWRTTSGKAGMVLSVILSLLLLWFTPVRVETGPVQETVNQVHSSNDR